MKHAVTLFSETNDTLFKVFFINQQTTTTKNTKETQNGVPNSYNIIYEGI